MPAVESESKSRLKFVDYQIENLNFRLNNEFNGKKVEVDFAVNSDISFNEDNTASVLLNLTVFHDAKSNNYPFELDLVTTGFFKIENFDMETDKKLIEVNAVAILFPYLRSLVSTITANANVRPLILPPINVVNLLRNEENK